jgi:DNA-binding NarL/FixJ family response regulator
LIRILLVDDHPALRAGLHSVMRAEPGFVPVGAAGDEQEMWPLLNRTKPDVVLMDYHLPGEDGLVLCRRIKGALGAPKVIVYSAYADTGLTVPALLAGADGVMNKGAPAQELFDAIRTVAGGGNIMPPLSSALLEAATARLDPGDAPVVGMLVNQTPLAEVAEVVGTDPAALTRRVERMIARLSVDTPASYA